MTIEQEHDLIRYKGMYSALSETSEYFSKPSTHKAALFIEKRMQELLDKIKEIENSDSKS